MKYPPDLRRRLTLSVLSYAVLLSSAIALHGYLVNESAEQTFWESLLRNEFVHIEERRARDSDYRWADNESLQLYGALDGKPIPAEFDAFAAGVHDEIRRAGKQFVVLVRGEGTGKSVLALDISDMERREQMLTWTIVLSSVALVILLTIVTYVGVGRLVRPLVDIARDIVALHPDRQGQRIAVPASGPGEAIVIAQALNNHLQRSDEFLSRELDFIRMTSHELRTPVSVIATAAEVALDDQGSVSSGSIYLQRILQTACGMRDLLTLLLALAKDPARLRSTGESVEVHQIIPSVVQDHLFLAEHKELTFRLQCSCPIVTRAPLQIVRATIGNLVRNAIENSDRGTINVATADDARVTITDPGHGMSEAELSQLYSQMARAGSVASGSGIGLDLIHRICIHFGWTIELASQPGRGTTVTLNFSAGG